MMQFLKGFAFACAILAPKASIAQEVGNFVTETGFCSQAQIEELERNGEIIGRTLTLGATQVLQSRGLNPASTPTMIPPLTALGCHTQVDDKVLVSSSGATSYCGWVSNEELLRATGGVAGGGSLFPSDSATCGVIQALSIADFCEDLNELGEPSRACLDERLSQAVFDTKFIVDNTSLTEVRGQADVSPVQVPLYDQATGEIATGEVTIFNVLRVYRVARGPDERLRLLIGVTGAEILGWIDAGSGTVWYSKLTTFFAAQGDGVILSDIPGAPSTSTLAVAPESVATLLAEGAEFQRYPVLLDRRQKDPLAPASFRPHLEIAFIGAFCGSGETQLCSNAVEPPSVPDYDLLNAADILFLIDGTASMEVYYDLVARAIGQVSDDYIGNFDYQFGVAMYGDYLDIKNVGIGDAMQFRYVETLTSIQTGEEFSDLSDAELFIDDALKDKPEASNEALRLAVLDTAWRGTSPRFVIHIADHGDRVPPNQDLIEALSDNNIIYMPIAVRGSEVLDASENFIRHSQLISERHVLESGQSLALPPNVTYRAGAAVNGDEYQAIAQALNGAIGFGEAVRQDVIDLLFNRGAEVPEVETDSSNFPPGYSDLTAAAVELFFGDLEDIRGDVDIENRTIAAIGYI